MATPVASKPKTHRLTSNENLANNKNDSTARKGSYPTAREVRDLPPIDQKHEPNESQSDMEKSVFKYRTIDHPRNDAVSKGRSRSDIKVDNAVPYHAN